MKVKLCGFKEEKSLETAIKMQTDFIGFIFHEGSPRYVSAQKAGEIAKIIPKNIAKVAVIVDADLSKLKEIAQELEPQYFQLHGNESKIDVLAIKKHFPNIKIIKAFKVSSVKDIEQSLDFKELADIFMFDNVNAGSGKSWDYSSLKNLVLEKPWFLSGGLNIHNVLEAIKMSGAPMIDISSGIEKERGVKSSELIIEFMNKVKNVT